MKELGVLWRVFFATYRPLLSMANSRHKFFLSNLWFNIQSIWHHTVAKRKIQRKSMTLDGNPAILCSLVDLDCSVQDVHKSS